MAPTDSEHYLDLGRPNYRTPQPLPNNVTIFMHELRSRWLAPAVPIAARNVLRGLHNGRQAYAVECTLQNRLKVAGITGDPGNGDDHVEYLFEGEVATDLLSALR
jgi:hypothetical protein